MFSRVEKIVLPLKSFENNISNFNFGNVNVFMLYYFEPKFIEKKILGKVLFKILATMEMTNNENRLFGHHLKTV